MAQTINLNDVQHEPIVVSGNLTAALNRYYVNTASATYTDPTPAQGEGYIVFVRNGTATIGGVGYATAGTIVYRYYHSGAWASYEKNSEIIVQTAAQWAVDATVYSEKRILVTSDEYYGNSNQRKFKIADGANAWSSLFYFGAEFGTLNLYGNLNLTGNGTVYSLTVQTNNLDTDETSLVYFNLTGSQNLTGLANGEEGQVKILYNDDHVDIVTLVNSSASSSLGNRFDFYPASNVTINPKQWVMVIYISSRWRYFGGGGSGITSLNALTGTTQTFATGTSGSDFNISSSGTIHTFNIPDASTTIRGALTAANFQTLKDNSNIFSIFRSGMWISTPYTSITSGAGWTADSIRAYPIAITKDVTFANIRAEVTTLIAGSNIRLGIATDSGGYPGTIVFDSGNISCASTGMKSAAVNMSFTASDRFIWLLLNMSVGTIGFRYASSTISYLGRPSAGGTTIGGLYRVASAFGAFPATYPAGAATEAHPLNGPLVEIEVA